MPRRTQLYTKIPWTGGVNDSVDPGILSDNDMQICDNAIFSTSGARIKRPAFDYFDNDLPAVTFRSSSGTTRTLVFAASLDTGTDSLLVVGEKLLITGTPTAYTTSTAVVATITTTTISNDTITYTATTGGSLSESSTATGTLTVKRGATYIGVHDYWRTDGSSIKAQRYIAVSDQGLIFRYDVNGNRLQILKDATATAFATTITMVNFEVLNDVLIMAFDGLGNTPKMYRPETDVDWFDLGGTPPDFSVMRAHQSRLFTNNKTNKDRLEYCSPGNPQEWGGVGDSGAVDIFPGDGDPDGIITIQPPFRGTLFVGKGRRLYKILGDSPENYTPDLVTAGLGSLSQKAVATIDLDDELFISTRGIHSLAATDQFGDFNAKFLSRKIQNTYNSFVSGRLKYTQCAYIPSINSVAFTVAEDGNSVQNAVWLFHVESQEWYRWPDIDCQCIGTRRVSAADTLMIGTSNSRLITPQAGIYTDFTTTNYRFKLKTGTIYPGGSPDAWVGFKKFSLYYKPKGTFTYTVIIKIDNQQAQSLSFSQTTGGDLLGSTFVLGTSRLGSDNVLAPYEQQIDGFGRGCTIEIQSSGTNEQVELYGFAIEYEPADKAQETIET